MASKTAKNTKKIALFDVDGTLTVARGKVTPEMNAFLAQLRERIVVGTVGGSDLPKQKEQLGDDVTARFDYVFAENGLTALKGEETLGSQSFRVSRRGPPRELINFILGYLANLKDVPVKRGTFIEYRNGMLNVSPIGRACSRPSAMNLRHGTRSASAARRWWPCLRRSLGSALV